MCIAGLTSLLARTGLCSSGVVKSILLLLLLLPSAVLADEISKRELIAQLFDVTGVRSTVEDLRKQNVELVRRQIHSQNAGTEFADNPIMQRLLTRVMEKYESYSREFMGWSSIEAKFYALYESSFTESQLKDTITFFRSDAGKAWMAFQAKSLSLAQSEAMAKAKTTQARIEQIMEETVAEVKKEWDANEEAKEAARDADTSAQEKRTSSP